MKFKKSSLAIALLAVSVNAYAAYLYRAPVDKLIGVTAPIDNNTTPLLSVASITAGSPVDFGSITQNSGDGIKSVTLTNTGNTLLNITGVNGLPSGVSLTSNTCQSVALAGTCTLTLTLDDSAVTAFSNVVASTVGATSNASFNLAGSVAAMADTNYANVTALMHFEGANLSTSWTEPNPSKSLGLSNFSSATISSEQAKFGSTSFKAGGSATAVSSTFAFGLNDFTVETWVFRTSSSQPSSIIDNRPTNANGYYISMGVTSDDRLSIYINMVETQSAAGLIPRNQWNHVAYSRKNGVGYLAVNGAIVATRADSGSYLASSFGRINANAWSVPMSTMYLDEYRVTNGLARYTSAYPVPTSAFPDQ